MMIKMFPLFKAEPLKSDIGTKIYTIFKKMIREFRDIEQRVKGLTSYLPNRHTGVKSVVRAFYYSS